MKKPAKPPRNVSSLSAAAPPATIGSARVSEELWLLLTEFALSMRGWWIETCYGLDLTPVQGLALRTLDPEAPLAMSALADVLVCDASNVTGVVDKLEARGLIARQAVESDRRVKMLVVTEKGRELRRQLLARAAKPPPEIAAMPRPAQKQLAGGLRSFLDGRKARELPAADPAAARPRLDGRAERN